jgi:plastocyanin
LLSSCRDAPLRDETLDIGGDTIRLAPGVRVHDIRIRARTGAEFEPDSVQARAADVLRFQTADARTHVIAFQDSILPAAARNWLAAKSQLRSPPLVVEGATWIVSLENAPAGTYTFQCVTHGVSGRVIVQ